MFITLRSHSPALGRWFQRAMRALRLKRALTLTFSAFTFALACPAFAAPGDLDGSFALSIGKYVHSVGNVNDSGRALAVLPDGKFIIAGSCTGDFAVSFCMTRYTASGLIDTSFGTPGTNAGKVIKQAAVLTSETAFAIAIQPDGKIVLAGSCASTVPFVGFQRNLCLMRFSADGTLDTSFGSAGTASTLASTNDANIVIDAVKLVRQPDGKLVVGGACSVGTKLNFCAARFLANGTLDSTFGDLVSGTPSGKVVTQIGTGTDTVRALALQPDGKLVLGGHCASTTVQMVFCLVRYTTSGVADSSFSNGVVSSGGIITLQISGTTANYLTDLALQADGKLVAAGHCGTGAVGCVIRLTGNGAVDATFVPVVGGTAATYLSNVRVQPDGYIVVSGYRLATPGSVASADFIVARLTDSGAADLGFGTLGNGTVLTPIATGSNPYDYGIALALQPDGKILVGGACNNGGPSGGKDAFCLARYEGGPFGYKNCKLDIDGDGSVRADTDLLVAARIALGFNGDAVVNGIGFPVTATRNTWPLIRDYLASQCGMSLVP